MKLLSGLVFSLLLSRIASIPNYKGNSNKLRPVIFMHGIFNKPGESNFSRDYISQAVPGILFYHIDLWNGIVESARNIDTQLSTILPTMQAIMDNHTDTGVTLLCYSQGGVICRAAVEMLAHHNVHTLITLSSPLSGQYGVTSDVEPFVPSKDRAFLWRFWYSWEGQAISIGNYWNDPHHQTKFADPELNVPLARLNNQFAHNFTAEYKRNFVRLERLVMIGGPNDTIITPWQSAHFGFYDKNETALPFEKQPWYLNDAFGLRTLNEANKVMRHTYGGLEHIYWYRTPAVFDCCVIPYIK
ncbi:lysosomal thioesterase PPT2-like [Watersipora subatra]|uniref:lysosomal thioesterase PPT2-like n=1 Tax=Watersipora subatra TaxID=2589382 RepID=UPI00355B4191